MQDLLTALTSGTYNAMIMLGSGGSGKTVACKSMHALAKEQYGEARAARCANSGRVAVNASCETFARRFRYGSHAARETPAYADPKVATEIAGIKVLIAEEATATPNRLAERHLGAYRDAKESVNWGRGKFNQPDMYTDLKAPIAGLKLVLCGDHLQQIVSSGGVGCVTKSGDDKGKAVPCMPPPDAGDNVWELKSLQHAQAKVLVVVMHDNHRLLGKMHEMVCTGCALLMSQLWNYAWLDS